MLGNSTPLVSILVPLFNRESVFSDTIASLQAQTYPHWEVVVVDDGSTDGSYEAVQLLAKEDSRIKLLRRDRLPKGAPTCRNIALENSLGKYCIFFDSDDLMDSSCLLGRVRAFERFPDFDFLVFPCELFSSVPGDLKILWNVDKETDDLERFLNLDAPWITSSPIWKKGPLDRLVWNEGLQSWQDMDFHVQALALRLKYKKIDIAPDTYYRQGEEPQISKNDKDIAQYFSRITLAKNIHAYLKKGNQLHQKYFDKLFYFHIWICLSFAQKKHLPGIRHTIDNLVDLKIVNKLQGLFYYGLFKITYYFICNSYTKKLFSDIRAWWLENFVDIFFPDTPPYRSTVKTISSNHDPRLKRGSELLRDYQR